MLPTDSHVHSEWSWDAAFGSMEGTCRQALDLGLSCIAFTEHADWTSWAVPAGVQLRQHWQVLVHEGVLTPPALDLRGYLAALDECRERFPGLRILTGVELSEPHWHPKQAAALLGSAPFQRVLASVHSLESRRLAPEPGSGGGYADLSYQIRLAPDQRAASGLVRAYLAEVVRMIGRGTGFEVLAHIDYPFRFWPAALPPYRLDDYADELEAVLAALAGSGRVLEINTRIPLNADVVRRWYRAGGSAVSFASDAHRPEDLARGFAAAAAMAEAAGFRPGREPHEFWCRSAVVPT